LRLEKAEVGHGVYVTEIGLVPDIQADDGGAIVKLTVVDPNVPTEGYVYIVEDGLREKSLRATIDGPVAAFMRGGLGRGEGAAHGRLDAYIWFKTGA
jgi:hypothetical protein